MGWLPTRSHTLSTHAYVSPAEAMPTDKLGNLCENVSKTLFFVTIAVTTERKYGNLAQHAPDEREHTALSKQAVEHQF